MDFCKGEVNRERDLKTKHKNTVTHSDSKCNAELASKLSGHVKPPCSPVTLQCCPDGRVTFAVVQRNM